MQIGNRFRCYPTPAQQQTLLQWIGCQRYIYNAKVGEDQYFRRFARKPLTHTGRYAPLDQQYSQFKTELTPWLFEVPEGASFTTGGVIETAARDGVPESCLSSSKAAKHAPGSGMSVEIAT
jgi:Helix-turn-helix domain